MIHPAEKHRLEMLRREYQRAVDMADNNHGNRAGVRQPLQGSEPAESMLAPLVGLGSIMQFGGEKVRSGINTIGQMFGADNPLLPNPAVNPFTRSNRNAMLANTVKETGAVFKAGGEKVRDLLNTTGYALGREKPILPRPAINPLVHFLNQSEPLDHQSNKF